MTGSFLGCIVVSAEWISPSNKEGSGEQINFMKTKNASAIKMESEMYNIILCFESESVSSSNLGNKEPDDE